MSDPQDDRKPDIVALLQILAGANMGATTACLLGGFTGFLLFGGMLLFYTGLMRLSFGELGRRVERTLREVSEVDEDDLRKSLIALHDTVPPSKRHETFREETFRG